MQFSIFYGGGRNTKPVAKPITLSDLIKLIKHDESIKDTVKSLKELKHSGNESEYKEAKLKLPYITPYGLFSERNNQSLIEGSFNWVGAIDIDAQDQKQNWDLSKTYQKIIESGFVILAFRSPSGKGIKAFVKLEAFSYDIEDHYEVYKQCIAPVLESKWDCKLDIRQGVLSQPLFLTHDPNLHYNRNYIDLQTDYTIKVQSPFKSQPKVINGKTVANNNDALLDLCKKIRNRESNKWDYFNKIAILAGGLYEGNQFTGLEEYEILSMLEDAAINNPFVEDVNVAKKQVYDGFHFGKDFPVTESTIAQKKGVEGLIKEADGSNKEHDKTDVFGQNRFIRVGDDYYQQIDFVNINGTKSPRLEKRSRQTIVDDFGKGFIKEIPKFETFCNVPSYTKYEAIHGNAVNLFQPFRHEPRPGEWDTIKLMLEHIFRDQFEMGLDYIQLLYQDPTQILPVLCLVSKENQTGKTTFLDFLEMLFQGNTAIISTADIEGDFNQHYVSKHIIMVDESDLHKSNTASKIKQMATQRSTFIKGKFQQERNIEYFGKLILVSNDERGFLSIKDEDIRYWVRKVPKLENFSGDFHDRIKNELPCFVSFISNREMQTKTKQSRAWFKTEDIETEWTKEAKLANRSDCFYALSEAINEWFNGNFDKSEMVATAGEIIRELLKDNPKYSNRYVSKTLRDEFGIESVVEYCTTSFQISHGSASHRVFRINKDTFYSLYGKAEKEQDADADLTANVVKMMNKSGFVDDRDENGELKGEMPF
tara:strand:+ start:3855 stop:6143 length:2289 start_codon:yes stop_codon:yes gene_type:complete